MRGVIALVVLATLRAAAAAPVIEPDARLAPMRLTQKELDRAGSRALWKRNVGIGLAVPGLTLMIVGSVVIGRGGFDPNLVGAGLEIASGSVTAGVGLPLAIAGIILWVMGQDDMDVVTWRRKQQTASLGPLSFTLRF